MIFRSLIYIYLLFTYLGQKLLGRISSSVSIVSRLYYLTILYGQRTGTKTVTNLPSSSFRKYPPYGHVPKRVPTLPSFHTLQRTPSRFTCL